jgi:hypothetical protein
VSAGAGASCLRALVHPETDFSGVDAEAGLFLIAETILMIRRALAPGKKG